MNLLRRGSHLLLALQLFASSAAFAQSEDLLSELVITGDMHGRNSLDFRKNAKNIQYFLPEGTEATIIETRKLSRTGSYGIRVRVTKVGTGNGGNLPKVGDESWIYFSQKDPWLTLKDKEGSDIQDPEIALTSRAKRDGEGLPPESGVLNEPTLPTKTEVLREQKPDREPIPDPNLAKYMNRTQTEAGYCIECHNPEPSVDKKNQKDLKDLSDELKKPSLAQIPDKKWSQFPEVVRYSTNHATIGSIKYGLRNKERRSKRLCYRYVKRALLGGDLVDDYLPGAMAKYGVSELKRRGFKNMLEDPKYANLIKNPSDAPKGAVLVYRNTRDKNHAGHIEIKTDWGKDGGYVSDFYRSNSQPLYNRELIGVMIKENP